MSKKKQKSGFLHKLFLWLYSYISIVISDLKKIYQSLTVAQQRKLILKNVWQFLKDFYQRFMNEGILKESASLTYITILGFVPFINFLVLLAPDLPFLNLRDKFREIVVQNFIPSSANAIISFLDKLIMPKVGFNIFNFVILLISSYSLFTVIRSTFDRILSMQLKTSLDTITQLVKFFGTIVFGLLIIVLLFSSSSLPIISRLLNSAVLQWVMVVVPFVLQFLAIMFLYMLLPSVRIQRGALFRGAFWTTVIWVIGKSAFDFYIYNLTNYQALYGVMAVLPIFLMWIYINWAIILGGMVLVSVIENKKTGNFLTKEPHNAVRITMELFTNKKINQRLEGLLDKKDLQKMVDTLNEDEEDK
ncbi:MAG: YihY family inner membrane protein [Candidatus Cloacimonas sp.]